MIRAGVKWLLGTRTRLDAQGVPVFIDGDELKGEYMAYLVTIYGRQHVELVTIV